MKQNAFMTQWLILGIAMAYLAGALGFNLYREHERVQGREQEGLLAQARVIEENAIENLVSINKVLLQLRKQLQHGNVNQSLNENFKILVDAMPGVRSLGVLDIHGNIMASSQPSLIGRNFSERDYFKDPRQHPDEALLYVSPPFSSALGVFSISASVIIPGTSGEFAGVVGVILDPQYFTTLLESVRYAPDMAVSIVHWDGVVFMTEPMDVGIAGKNLAQPDSFFTRHKDSGRSASVYSGPTYATGKDRMVALRTIQSNKLKLNKPLVITATRAPDEIFSAWRKDLTRSVSLFGFIAIFSTLALYFVQRRQRESNLRLNDAAKELHAKQIQIKENEEKYRAIIETTDTGYVILDANGRVKDANREYIRLSGHTKLDEIFGRNPMEWTANHDRERMAQEIEKCMVTGCFRNLEIDYIDEHGRISPVEINGTVIHRKASLQIVSLCRDISERKRSQEQIEYLAYYDALTDLPNRRLMLERLTYGLNQAKRYHRSLALMFMDIDHFKEVNDALGHDVGDELLKVVSQRLKGCVRNADTVSRQGGDEFVILLMEINQPEDATIVAEKVMKIMRDPLIVLKHELRVTISIGIAVFPGDGVHTPMDLMKRADIAMYVVKKDGGDGFRVDQPTTPSQQKESLPLSLINQTIPPRLGVT